VNASSTMKATLRFLRRAAVALFVAVLLWSLLIMLFESRFIFFPDRYPTGRYNEAHRIPGLRDEWFAASDGIRLHAWYAPAEQPIATLVMAHGNAGNLTNRLEIIRALRRRGFNVFMFDYRGYGRSEGNPDEAGVYLDGRAAFDHVQAMNGNDSTNIVLWGTSLGGAVALDVALDRPVAGLILESTFTSAPAMASRLYPWLPIGSFLQAQFNSIDKIARYRGPVLVIHGERDGLIPFEMGKELFEAAQGAKEMYAIAEADHNDTFWIGGEEYLERVERFARRAVGGHP